MARKKNQAKPEPTVTREEIRESYDVEVGLEIPPIVHESVYPWGRLGEIVLDDHEAKPSFFKAFDSQEDAEKRRSSIQTSGRSYYTKRSLPLTVHSRVTEEDGVYGVRSWAVYSA